MDNVLSEITLSGGLVSPETIHRCLGGDNIWFGLRLREWNKKGIENHVAVCSALEARLEKNRCIKIAF